MAKQTEVERLIDIIDAEIVKLQERKDWLLHSRVKAAISDKPKRGRKPKARGLPAKDDGTGMSKDEKAWVG